MLYEKKHPCKKTHVQKLEKILWTLENKAGWTPRWTIKAGKSDWLVNGVL